MLKVLLVPYLLILFLLPLAGHALTETEVISAEAIVYADQELTSPIGTLPQGTRLTIGSKSRLGGQVRTTIINKKLVFIKSVDLLIDNIEAPIDSALKKHRQHNVPDQIDGTILIDKLDQNNYINIYLGQFNPGSQWDTLATSNGDSAGGTIRSYSFMIEHRPVTHNTFGGIGFGYYNLVQNQISFSAITLDGALYWSPVYRQKFSIDLFFQGQVSAGVVVDGKGWDNKYKGSLIGIALGAQVRWLLLKHLGAVGGFSIKRWMLNGLNQVPTDTGSENLDKFNGLAIFIGMIYRL
ncbi:MAG: hypothetical protein HN353_04425 [Bdellovibrionales bacterium]|nr:hypothetical protein [Bdellovibrionales bacterium]MBT7766020.1 hypothetical protein [Bdellovibrionales bacterium]